MYLNVSFSGLIILVWEERERERERENEEKDRERERERERAGFSAIDYL